VALDNARSHSRERFQFRIEQYALKSALGCQEIKVSVETATARGVMGDRAADFTGSIPIFYDRGLGPIFFAEFADDIAQRVVASAPTRVLEIAAGTGIVTRRLRDLLPRRSMQDRRAPSQDQAAFFLASSIRHKPMPQFQSEAA